MKFIFLGTTGYHPNNRRQTASILFPELGLVLDAGTGLFRARDLLQTAELNIFLSHAHLDHCLGLTFLFDIAHQTGLKESSVYGEPEKLEAIKNHLLNELIFPAELPISYCPLEGPRAVGSTFELDRHTRVTPFPLKHPGGSIGFLVEQDGKRIAYVTDTT
ncbi:MAG: MBL fold metallo-hydrolase, partial [Planctomycetota bacterium]|nr:MBL fold metallo-hydrolase [Planctomycetota bacterium]